MESNPKESCRKDCSRGRERKVDLIGIHPDVTCEVENCCHVCATNSKSSLEIHHVNSAVYTEPVSEEERDAVKSETLSEFNHHQRKDRYKKLVNCSGSKSSVIDSSDVALHTATKSGTSEQAVTGQNTYRCYSTTLPDAMLFPEYSTTRSAVSSETTARVERRCKLDSALENACQNEAIRRERYIDMDNRQVVRISITSLSDPDVSNCKQLSSGTDFARRTAHSKWVRRKYEAAQHKREDEERAMKKRQEEEDKTTREKEERARLEKQHVLKWMEGKRRQELDKKDKMLQNKLELQKLLKEIEDKAAVAKEGLRKWIHKKKEEQKGRHKEQESRQRKVKEEREKRLEQCSKAYERWRRDSKNRPKPATQGLLPHQKAKPAYVNPIPWQSIVEMDSDEAEEDVFNDKNRDASQLKMNGARTVVIYQ